MQDFVENMFITC